MRAPALYLAMLCITLPISPVTALEAGAVEGQWCSEGGQTITVTGLSVIAANGLTTTGAYAEKAFHFVEPRNYGRDGPEIWMEPKGANAVRVSVVSPDQKEPPPHDLWTRCRVTS